MISLGKHAILGVDVSAVDYDAAVAEIMTAARAGRGMAVSALAVHGVMTGALDRSHRSRLNTLDLVVPDGQPVRWALRILHRIALPDRVRGPDLMLRVCEHAAGERLPVYLYGSTPSTLARLSSRLRALVPGLEIAGSQPSAFRALTELEQRTIASRIAESGARVVFVGLGCPRQEVWAFEHRGLLDMPIVAVGAAFDFHAGTQPEAPEWMQRTGLEWLFRLAQEPRRLWRRYVLLNPLYLLLVTAQFAGLFAISSRTGDVPLAERPG